MSNWKYRIAGGLALALAGAAAAQPSESSYSALGCAVLGAVTVVAVVALYASWIWLAARWTKQYGTFWTAVGAVLLNLLFSLPINFAIAYFYTGFFGDLSPIGLVVLGIVSGTVVGTLAIKLAYSSSYLLALMTYLVASLLSVVTAAVIFAALFAVIAATGNKNRVTAAFQQIDVPPAVKELVAFSPTAPDKERRFVDRPRAEALHYVGREVRVVLTDDSVVSGILEEAGREALVIRQQLRGGSVTFPVKRAKIQTFQVPVDASE